MKKLTKYAIPAGIAASLAPLAALAQDYDYSYTTTDSAATAASAGLGIGMLIIWGLMMIVGIFLFVFWIIMLIDTFKRTNWKQESDKTLWIILVIVLGYLGAIIYYFAIKRPLDKGGKTPPPPAQPQAPTPPPAQSR